MPLFQYNALDASGKTLKGSLDAVTLQDAIGKLKGMGYFITNIVTAKSSKSEISSLTPVASPQGQTQTQAQPKPKKKKKASAGLSLNMNLSLLGNNIKGKELTVITRQLSTLIGSGLPLLRSLKVIEEQSSSGAAVIRKIAANIEEGALFSESLAKFPRSFPRVYVAMVKAGEASGSLEIVLKRLADFMEREAKIKGKIKSAMAYPVMVIIMAALIVTFIMLKIIPVFAGIFKSMGAGSLPGPTLLLMHISSLFQHKFYLVVLWVIAIVIVYKILNKVRITKYWIDKAKMRMPVFGPVVSKTIFARFAGTFATLITSGVPILQSIQIVRDTVGNSVVAKALNEIRNRVREGEGIAGVMRKTKVFPPMVTHMIAVGEETGAIDSMLEKVADAYESEVDAAVNSLTSIMEPLLIVFLGGIVGFIVIAIYMPLIKLALSMEH